MICKLSARILLLAFILKLSFPLRAADTLASTTKATSESTSAASHLKPGPDAGKIAFVTTKMLEEIQYLRHPFDATISSRFFDAYLNSLDPQHLHFLQSDLAEFSAYRTNLSRLINDRRREADTTPAYEIFSRYMERLQQHVAYVEETLKKETFEFNSNDRATLSRRELPYPKNLDEAKQIWHERLRYEYLIEKLGPEKVNSTNSVQTKTDSLPTYQFTNRFEIQNAETNSLKTATASNQPEKHKPTRDEIVAAINKNYHRTLHLFEGWDSNDVLNDYLLWLARSYDPHSDYQGPMDYEDFAMQMNLSLVGIGASLRSEDGYCKIIDLLNGPAKLSGKIKEGDRIVKVAQSNQPPVDIVDMPINKAVRLIRGIKGTEVRLTIIPVGTPESTREVVKLVRDEIKLENGEAKGKIIEMAANSGKTAKLGIIDLPSFYAPLDPSHSGPYTSVDVAKLLKKFEEENVAGVILDLRRNGGGSLEEAIRLAGLFIKQGPIVQIRHFNGDIDVREDTDSSVAYDGPLILLTSRLSASASEIVAGALQDYGRALIVGDASTFGKGTAQQIYPLSGVRMLSDMTNDPGTLKVTNSKFYRASGASTESKGVLADIVLPSLWNDSPDIGETNLENHLPYDTIPTSTFEKLNLVQPELAELTKRASARMATNKDFDYLREDIEQLQKQRADKTVSLNEKQQLTDREQIISRHKQREQERASRKVTKNTVYELTVENAGKPGLPPPAKETNSVSTASAELDEAMPDADVSNELGEALRAEMDHAEAVRLEEAERILMDYIDRFPKPSPTLLAK
jgi:carboxyl-terminal processing protease